MKFAGGDPYLVGFSPEAAFAVRRDGVLCELNLGNLSCKPLFKIAGGNLEGSIDPGKALLSFIDHNGWRLVTREGVAVTHIGGVTDARWIGPGRLIMTTGESATAYDVSRKRSVPIPSLVHTTSFATGNGGVVAALRTVDTLFYSHAKNAVVGRLAHPVARLAFNSSGRRFAALLYSGEIETYELDDGVEGESKADDSGVRLLAREDALKLGVQATTENWAEQISALSFSRDDSMILASGYPARLMAASSLRTLDRFDLPGRDVAYPAFFSRTDRIGLHTDSDGGISKESESGIPSRLVFRTDATNATFSNDGSVVLMATPNGVKAFNLDGSLARAFGDPLINGQSDVVTNPNTTDVIVLRGQQLSRWTRSGSRPVWVFDLPESPSETSMLRYSEAPFNLAPFNLGPAWSPDGRWVAMRNRDTLYLLDAATGSVVRRTNAGETMSIRFSADSKQVRVGRIDFTNGVGMMTLIEYLYPVSDLKRTGYEKVFNSSELPTLEERRKLGTQLAGLRGNLEKLHLQGLLLPIPPAANSCVRVDVQADKCQPIR